MKKKWKPDEKNLRFIKRRSGWTDEESMKRMNKILSWQKWIIIHSIFFLFIFGHESDRAKIRIYEMSIRWKRFQTTKTMPLVSTKYPLSSLVSPFSTTTIIMSSWLFPFFPSYLDVISISHPCAFRDSTFDDFFVSSSHYINAEIVKPLIFLSTNRFANDFDSFFFNELRNYSCLLFSWRWLWEMDLHWINFALQQLIHFLSTLHDDLVQIEKKLWEIKTFNFHKNLLKCWEGKVITFKKLENYFRAFICSFTAVISDWSIF